MLRKDKMPRTPTRASVCLMEAVPQSWKRASGFTLIEMLMTIAIAAILMGIAIPSFRYITNANRIE